MKKILITSRPWERRVAIIENGLLESIFFDSKSSPQLERSFFKGKVSKILPGVQTAFVDIAQEKSGFLHISEIDRNMAFKKMDEFDDDEEELDESIISEKNQLDIRNVNIATILQEGQYILAQVGKEPINDKGAKLTTCFTLPGRFVILMPNIQKIGVSKRIADPDERKRLKEMVLRVLPEGAGCIIRTICEGQRDEEIIKDINYLANIWNNIQKKYSEAKSVERVYSDIDLVLQVVRDNLDENIESIICDDIDTLNVVKRFINNFAHEYLSKIFIYEEKIPLFDFYFIEEQIQKLLSSKVELNNGGSIVIDTAEAMTVVDVNTARFIGSSGLEDTIFKTNMEASKEIVRQLKLRNIVGLVVIDFIDMRIPSNRNRLFSFFEKTLKEKDKSQSVVLKISEFGLVQMTRKRTGKTIKQQLLNNCSHCNGTGVTKSLSERTYELFRNLEKALLNRKSIINNICHISMNEKFSSFIIDVEHDTLLDFEKKHKIKIVIKRDDSSEDIYKFEWLNGVI